MAKIIENRLGRRLIRLNPNDIISIVQEYQTNTIGLKDYKTIRNKINLIELYIPEDV